MYCYSLPQSKCVHKFAECKKSRVKNAQPVLFNNAMRKCRHCFASKKCFICQEEYEICHASCHEHNTCTDCLNDYVTTLSESPVWDFEVGCPCGNRTSVRLPQTVEDRVNKLKEEGKKNNSCVMRRRHHLDVAIEDILTLRCPHCNAAFHSFDGCLALECRCQRYFCGLCCVACADDDDAHRHVLQCNPQNNYFMPIVRWERFQHDRKCVLLWRYVLQVFNDTKSVMYLSYLIANLNKFDYAMIPSRIQPGQLAISLMKYCTFPICYYYMHKLTIAFAFTMLFKQILLLLCNLGTGTFKVNCLKSLRRR